MEVQTGLEQGASPSSQYSLPDTAVNETGSKPAGTGPPADPEGCAPAVVVDEEVLLTARVVVVGRVGAVVVLVVPAVDEAGAVVVVVMTGAVGADVLDDELGLEPPQAESRPPAKAASRKAARPRCSAGLSTDLGAGLSAGLGTSLRTCAFRQASNAAAPSPTELLTLELPPTFRAHRAARSPQPSRSSPANSFTRYPQHR